MSDQKDIVIKAWDTFQNLIAGLGEECWKIRSVFYTASFGLIAAAFSSDIRGLYLLNPPLAILFCVLEAGYQQIQQQYIEKSTSIEVTINDMLALEAEPRMPDAGVSTSLVPPTPRALLRVFNRKKYLFWLSYLIVILISLTLFGMNVTKSKFAGPPSSPCPTVCCPCAATPSITSSK
jgi:hypothetical protein